jgi:hypothetical protein
MLRQRQCAQLLQIDDQSVAIHPDLKSQDTIDFESRLNCKIHRRTASEDITSQLFKVADSYRCDGLRAGARLTGTRETIDNGKFYWQSAPRVALSEILLSWYLVVIPLPREHTPME